MGGGSGVSFWREIIFLVQVYLNLAEKQANGPKGVQITLNFSIKGINKHFCFRPVSYTHLTLPTNREV